MADAFNLTAQLNLRGPSNIKNVVADIRRQLGTVNASLNFKVDPAANRNISQLNSSLKTFNSTLAQTQTSANNTARALSNLARTVNNINVKNLPQQLSSSAISLNKMSSAASSTAKTVTVASTAVEELGKQSYLAVKRFAAFSIPTAAVFGLTNAINKGIAAFIEYDKQFIKLQQVTGESAKGLQNLSNTITGLATGLGVASSDITEVASTLAQAGLSARDTERALKALSLSSLAPSFDSMNETVEGSIALMRQFDISAGDLEKALGSVNAVAAKFAVEASDIITAIQRTGGVFATASKGVSGGIDALNEFIAVFTSVRATTRESAETIATGLRTIFTRIQRGGTIEALKEYGVNLTDLDGKFVGAYKAVELLSKGLSKLDPRDLKFSEIVEELGGFRQIGKVIPLIQQFATAQDALKVAQKGQGSLAADAAKAQESLANKITKVKEEFFALFREIGSSQGFQTIIRGALDLSSALIKVADSIKGILPALTIFTAFKGVSALTQFTTGFAGAARARKAEGGPVYKFQRGGIVPGSGKGDKVPALLEPGEVVINNAAANIYGRNNLNKINKRATGGKISDLGGSVIRSSIRESTFTYNKNSGEKFKLVGSEPNKFNTRDKYLINIITKPVDVNKLQSVDKYKKSARAAKYGASKTIRASSAQQRGYDFEEILEKNFGAKRENKNTDRFSRLDGIIGSDVFEAKSTEDSTDSKVLANKMLSGALSARSKSEKIVSDRLTKTYLDNKPNTVDLGNIILFQDVTEGLGAKKQKASGGLISKFKVGGKALGARSKFKELSQEEIYKLSTPELIAYGKALSRDIFTTGGSGIAVASEFIEVPKERIIPELEPYLKTYAGKRGFWSEKISPFGRPSKKSAKIDDTKNRQRALAAQTDRYSDEVAARDQRWTNIRSGSSIDNYLLKSLQEPVLSDYRTARGGSSLSKTFHNTRLRQAVNKALEKYDDFDYSAKSVDKLVSGMAAKRFDGGGIVQSFSDGGLTKAILAKIPSPAELASGPYARGANIPTGQSWRDILKQIFASKGIVYDTERQRVKLQTDKGLAEVSLSDTLSSRTLTAANFRTKVGSSNIDQLSSIRDLILKRYATIKENLLESSRDRTDDEVKNAQSQDLFFGAVGMLGNEYRNKPITISKGLTSPVDAVVSGYKLDEKVGRSIDKGFSKDISKSVRKAARKTMINQIISDVVGGNKLFLDFDRTLAFGADKILKDPNKPQFSEFSDRNKVSQALSRARLSNLGRSLVDLIKKSPDNTAQDLLRSMSIISARPKNTLDLVQKWLATQGLPIPLSQFSGVGGPSVTEEDVARLKASLIPSGSSFVDDNSMNVEAAEKAGIRSYQYNFKRKTESKDLATAKGISFQEMIRYLGGPDPNPNKKSIDFPSGIGAAAKYFRGIDPRIPTDAKRTISGSSDLKDNIKNYLIGTGRATRVKKDVSKFAFGGSVSGSSFEQIKDQILKKYPQIDFRISKRKSGFGYMIQAGLSADNRSQVNFASNLKDLSNVSDKMAQDILYNYGPNIDQKLLKQLQKKKFASGGIVPAMVSNGEAYVSPETAKSIGYAKLHKMNRADSNGLSNFASGGISIFKGQGSGTSDSIGPIGLPEGSFILREKATKALGLASGGIVSKFARGGKSKKQQAVFERNVTRSADNSIKAAGNQFQGLKLFFASIENMANKLPASKGLIDNLNKSFNGLNLTTGISLKAARQIIETKIREAEATGKSTAKIQKMKEALNTLNAVQDAAINKLNNQRNAKLQEYGPAVVKSIDNRFSNMPGYSGAKKLGGLVSGVGRSLSGQSGFMASIALGALAGQGENIFGKESGRRTQTGILARTGASNAFTSAGLEAGTTTLSAGIATASSLAMIPGVGPFAAALVAGVSVVKAWTNAVEAGKQALAEYNIAQRQKRIDDASDRLNKALSDLQKKPNDNKNQSTVISEALSLSREVDLKNSQVFEEEQRKKATNRNWTQWWNGETPQLDNKDVETMSKDRAKEAEVAADAIKRIIEARIESGSTLADISQMPDFKSFTAIIASSNPEFVQLTNNIRNLSAEDQKSIITRRLAMEADKLLADAGFKAQESAMLASKAMDEVNRAGRKLAMSFDRLINDFNQALGRTIYELEVFDKSISGTIEAFNGNATVGGVNNRDVNILQNPNAYSAAERDAAQTRAASYFGKDSEAVKGMLKVDATDFSASITQALDEKVLKNNASGTLEQAAGVAKKVLQDKLKDAPENVRNQLLNQLEAVKGKVDTDTNLKTDKEKVDKFNEIVSKELGQQALDSAKNLKELSIRVLEFNNGALNEYIRSTNLAAEASRKSEKYRTQATNTRIQSGDALRSTLGYGGPTTTELQARQDARIKALTGGTTDAKTIRDNITKDIALRNDKQTLLKTETDKNKQTVLIAEIDKLNKKIINGQEALDDLSNSGETAAAALDNIKNIQQAMEGQAKFLDRLASATPEDAEKLGSSLQRLFNNINGIRNPQNNIEAQKAYEETFSSSGGNLNEAMRAGYGVLAQQRGEVLSLFEDLKPVIRNQMYAVAAAQGQTVSEEDITKRINNMQANLRMGVYGEAGMLNNPLLAGLASQTISDTRDPRNNQAIQRQIGISSAATEAQVNAQLEQAKLADDQASFIMKSASERFDDAVKNFGAYADQIRDNDPSRANAQPAALPQDNARGGLIRLSRGGNVVSAMVSKGEGYISPEMVKSIGIDKLHRMNMADKDPSVLKKSMGGKIGVFDGSGTGTSDSIGPIGLPEGSFVIRASAMKTLGFAKGGVVGLAQGGPAKPPRTRQDIEAQWEAERVEKEKIESNVTARTAAYNSEDSGYSGERADDEARGRQLVDAEITAGTRDFVASTLDSVSGHWSTDEDRNTYVTNYATHRAKKRLEDNLYMATGRSSGTWDQLDDKQKQELIDREKAEVNRVIDDYAYNPGAYKDTWKETNAAMDARIAHGSIMRNKREEYWTPEEKERWDKIRDNKDPRMAAVANSGDASYTNDRSLLNDLDLVQSLPNRANTGRLANNAVNQVLRDAGIPEEALNMHSSMRYIDKNGIDWTAKIEEEKKKEDFEARSQAQMVRMQENERKLAEDRLRAANVTWQTEPQKPTPSAAPQAPTQAPAPVAPQAPAGGTLPLTPPIMPPLPIPQRAPMVTTMPNRPLTLAEARAARRQAFTARQAQNKQRNEAFKADRAARAARVAGRGLDSSQETTDAQKWYDDQNFDPDNVPKINGRTATPLQAYRMSQRQKEKEQLKEDALKASLARGPLTYQTTAADQTGQDPATGRTWRNSRVRLGAGIVGANNDRWAEINDPTEKQRADKATKMAGYQANADETERLDKVNRGKALEAEIASGVSEDSLSMSERHALQEYRMDKMFAEGQAKDARRATEAAANKAKSDKEMSDRLAKAERDAEASRLAATQARETANKSRIEKEKRDAERDARIQAGIDADKKARTEINPLTKKPYLDAAEKAGVEAKARFDEKFKSGQLAAEEDARRTTKAQELANQQGQPKWKREDRKPVYTTTETGAISPNWVFPDGWDENQKQAFLAERRSPKTPEVRAKTEAQAQSVTTPQTQQKSDTWVGSKNWLVKGLGYVGGLGQATGEMAYGAANVVAGTAISAGGRIYQGGAYLAGSEAQQAAGQAFAQVGEKAIAQGAYTAVEAAQAVAGQGPIMTGDKTWLHQGDDERVKQAGSLGGITRLAQNTGYVASQLAPAVAGFTNPSAGAGILEKSARAFSSLDNLATSPGTVTRFAGKALGSVDNVITGGRVSSVVSPVSNALSSGLKFARNKIANTEVGAFTDIVGMTFTKKGRAALRNSEDAAEATSFRGWANKAREPERVAQQSYNNAIKTLDMRRPPQDPNLERLRRRAAEHGVNYDTANSNKTNSAIDEWYNPINKNQGFGRIDYVRNQVLANKQADSLKIGNILSDDDMLKYGIGRPTENIDTFRKPNVEIVNISRTKAEMRLREQIRKRGLDPDNIKTVGSSVKRTPEEAASYDSIRKSMEGYELGQDTSQWTDAVITPNEGPARISTRASAQQVSESSANTAIIPDQLPSRAINRNTSKRKDLIAQRKAERVANQVNRQIKNTYEPRWSMGADDYESLNYNLLVSDSMTKTADNIRRPQGLFNKIKRQLFGISKQDKLLFKELTKKGIKAKKEATKTLRELARPRLSDKSLQFLDQTQPDLIKSIEQFSLNANDPVGAFERSIQMARDSKLQYNTVGLKDLKNKMSAGSDKTGNVRNYFKPQTFNQKTADWVGSPSINIGPKSIPSDKVHEFAHFFDLGPTAKRVGYSELKSRSISANLDNFIQSRDFQIITQKLKLAYTPKRLMTVEPYEIFSILNQAKTDPRTKKMFLRSDGPKILSDLFTHHGFSGGGLVSSDQKETINDILGSKNPSFAYAKTMKLGLSSSDAARQAMIKNGKPVDSKLNKQRLLKLVENSEYAKKQKRKLYRNKRSGGGLIYADNEALLAAQKQGPDNQPVMATPGEFMVKKPMAQKHLQTLQAINAGYYKGGMVQYLNNGGVVGPKYYNAGGGVSGVPVAGRSGNGVNNTAASSAPEWLAQLDEKVNKLSSSLQESLSTMYSNLDNVANKLTTVSQEMPREMSITSNVNKNVNVNGIAGEWNKYQGDILKIAGDRAVSAAEESNTNKQVALSKWSEGQIPIV